MQDSIINEPGMVGQQSFKGLAEAGAISRVSPGIKPVVPLDAIGQGRPGQVGRADKDFLIIPISEKIGLGVEGMIGNIVKAQLQLVTEAIFKQIEGDRLGDIEIIAAQNPDRHAPGGGCFKILQHQADAGAH